MTLVSIKSDKFNSNSADEVKTSFNDLAVEVTEIQREKLRRTVRRISGYEKRASRMERPAEALDWHFEICQFCAACD